MNPFVLSAALMIGILSGLILGLCIGASAVDDLLRPKVPKRLTNSLIEARTLIDEMRITRPDADAEICREVCERIREVIDYVEGKAT